MPLFTIFLYKSLWDITNSKKKKKKKAYGARRLVVIMFFTKYGAQTNLKSIVKQFTGNILSYISK